MSHLRHKCQGKESCKISLAPDSIYLRSPSYKTVMQGEGVCGADAYFFVQMPCLFPPQEFTNRLVKGLVLSCTVVFLYLLTLIQTDYIKVVQKNKYVDWDVRTVTAGDYTVEFFITKAMYDEFVAKFYDDSNPLTKIA